MYPYHTYECRVVDEAGHVKTQSCGSLFRKNKSMMIRVEYIAIVYSHFQDNMAFTALVILYALDPII